MKSISQNSHRGLIVAIAMFLCIAAVFIFALTRTDASSRYEQEQQLRSALVRASVTCYAVEGRYPQDIQYIKANYGVAVDETRYVVSYDIIGSNLMPVITVTLREGAK